MEVELVAPSVGRDVRVLLVGREGGRERQSSELALPNRFRRRPLPLPTAFLVVRLVRYAFVLVMLIAQLLIHDADLRARAVHPRAATFRTSGLPQQISPHKSSLLDIRASLTS